MSRFDYVAVDAEGRRRTGLLEAPDRAAALDALQRQALAAVSLSEAGAASARAEADGDDAERHRTYPKAVSESFCRELAGLLKAGISISRALAVLAGQGGRARGLYAGIHADVVGGMGLAEAMARREGAFTRVQVAMVRAGETGGFLDVVLGQIAEFQATQRDLVGRVQAALAYPLVLCAVAAVVVIFLLAYFIPRFATMFSGLGGTLPALTRGIMALSEALVRHGPALAALLLVAVIVARRLLRSESAIVRLHGWLLEAPLIGPMIAQFARVRFCSMLSSLIAAGVPLVAALRTAREALGNRVLAAALGRAIDDVVAGRSLSGSLRAEGRLFPATAMETIAVAEESGRLAEELGRLAEHDQAALDRRLRMLVALLEPLLLVVMAAMVGTIVVGMLLPIFNLQDLIT